MLSGVIYIRRISDRRFTGVARRNFDIFYKLFGDAASKNIVLVTNMWGEVTPEVGEACERELSSSLLKPVLELGAQMTRHHNTVESAHEIIRRITKSRPVVLQIQRELVDEHKDIADTAAGEAINRELNEQMRRHQAELKKVEEDMVQALKEKDEETLWELEAERRKMQGQMEKMKIESDGMSLDYAVEKARMEAKMNGVEWEVKRLRGLPDTTVPIPIHW